MRICNPVLADCPPIKEEHSMSRQSDNKITALYCRLSRDDELQGDKEHAAGQSVSLDRRYRSRHFRASRVSRAYGKLQDLQAIVQEQKNLLQSQRKAACV